MVIRRAILALLLAASPALAFPPSALEDMMAGLVATAGGGGGGYYDLVDGRDPTAMWITLRTDSISISGTNVTAWTDIVGGIIAAPTNASTTPWWDAAAFGGQGAVVFSGAQALNLSANLSSTNSTTIVAGWKATGMAWLVVLSRHDSDGGPSITLGNNMIYFHPDANDKGVVGVINGVVYSNNVIAAFSHTGGNVTTNNALIYQQGTNLVGVAGTGLATYDQPGPGPIYNRIGGRRNLFSVGRICAIVHYQPELTDEQITNAIARLKTLLEMP